MTPQEKADGARELLKNPSFKAVMAELRSDLVGQLEQVALTDFELEHEAVRTLQVLKQIEAKLNRFIDDAAVERKKQEQVSFIEKQRQRLSGVWR